ncbi:hypothetical protein [Roseiterribacter gracilis]|uniref:Uncharacterized protein n=1 Tax=Roseiterribacter gracilis TaxID=2812848 RepID=A0A8S8XAE0_9PROT|nr:hypothetical protein TMPK1_03330 [Rhodospirillales bacterium TMPK1]
MRRLNILLAAAFVASAAASAHDPGHGDTPLREEVQRDLARARAATARFKDVQASLDAGYQPTDVCVSHPAHGAMGFHYKKPSLRDAIVDEEQPEILLYARAPNGALKLTGVEYVVPLDAWTQPTPPVAFGQTMRREETLQIWYLHVWLWENNSAGIFSDWNPALKC